MLATLLHVSSATRCDGMDCCTTDPPVVHVRLTTIQDPDISRPIDKACTVCYIPPPPAKERWWYGRCKERPGNSERVGVA